MKRGFAILLAISCFLGGIILGFLLSPVKYGVSIGNNSGNQNYLPLDEPAEFQKIEK